MHGLTLTADDTEGLKALVNPMNAKVAFFCFLLMVVVADGIIGADLHTGLATVAPLLIQNHRTVFPFTQGLQWAGIHAGGLGAVVAKPWQETHFQVGKATLWCILLGRILGLNTDPVFFGGIFYLASHGAGLASKTAFLVDDKSQSLFQPVTSSVLISHRRAAKGAESRFFCFRNLPSASSAPAPPAP
jgi:hypothetical protein